MLLNIELNDGKPIIKDVKFFPFGAEPDEDLNITILNHPDLIEFPE